jgi:CRISPR-associated protein Cmr6
VVLGPLGRIAAVDVDDRLGGLDGSALDTANPLLVLRRCAIPKVKRGAGPDLADGLDDGPIRRWAVESQLGQGSSEGAELLAAVSARRAAAALSMHHADPKRQAAGSGQDRGPVQSGPSRQPERQTVIGLRLRPNGPVLIGTGDGGVRDVGISLHGTYGWPTLPGSALKGAAHAYARDEELPAKRLTEPELVEIFGSPRPGHPTDSRNHRAGAVTFLDAVPLEGGVSVTSDVLTPHVQPYYTHGKPPAEYWSPVPVGYLSVCGGVWLALLVGPHRVVTKAALLLGHAAADLGFGAKTSAGYGYFTVAGAVRGREFATIAGGDR